ncbi:NAF1-domain-containing protein [Macrolepiota fuliginosa MF-IS2]|uniref:H/ACA ribonucleoprotein complex non-core subunit NAF1 n=1 Tax=Macrolepiota fuliginosa MF-IS2 TaxID=1400762 RepID=A0A9P5XMH1_9AGAR|nr:NAF1-domain-containing protein [Macrolepiota fuliginosa MF-IS2]
MATFKVPQTLPQDLLLISEFVNLPEEQKQKPAALEQEDDVASSGSENESEEEIEKDLTALPDDEEGDDKKPIPSDFSSSSETDSSISGTESEVEEQIQTVKPKAPVADFEDDEDPVSTTNTYPQTKNEVVDAAVTIPDLEQVEADEQLEKVGEIMSIVDNVVIIKGLASGYANRGSASALDSDTLLVFGDRKVMGYIYETFGPTSQPLYQVRFNQTFPLDSGKVQVGRDVFHVPRRSHFVFVNRLEHFKGSDASNVHDEEPADDELEFSDDEAEAAYRSRLKRKRAESRTRSVSSSRQSTPTPSQMRDQDMMTESILSKSAYDEHGPYDLDYGASSSRPAPKPYDDPYSDAYNTPKLKESIGTSDYQLRIEAEHTRPSASGSSGRGPSRSGDGRGRGRGRGRGKRGTNVMRGSFGREDHRVPSDNGLGNEEYDPRMPYESPPSPYLQEQNNYAFNSVASANTNPNATWGYPNQVFGQSQNQQSYMYPSPSYHAPHVQPSTFVQPHINPRFASAFGFQMAPNTSTFAQGSPGSIAPPPISTPSQGWADQWSVPVTDASTPKGEPPS